MQNSVDISRSEGEILDLLHSEPSIVRVERQVRVSLFCVDFRVHLANEKVLLLDALGGSLF
jgi:hypothetical protein